MHDERAKQVLICRVHQSLCAVPLQHVIETMRPLAVDAVAGMPAYMLGLAIIRGMPVPVLDVARLIHAGPMLVQRLVTVRCGARTLALALGEVVGVRALLDVQLLALPPLLRAADGDFVAQIGTLDQQVLLVLRDLRLLPDSVWSGLPAHAPS